MQTFAPNTPLDATDQAFRPPRWNRAPADGRRLLVGATAAVLLTLATETARAHEWVVDKLAVPRDDGSWSAGCYAYLGTKDSHRSRAGKLEMWVNDVSIRKRRLRGDPDTARPVLFLWARVNHARSRPASAQPFGKLCPDGYATCADEWTEYRVRYRVDATPGRVAWVQSFYAWVADGQLEDADGEPRHRENAGMYWLDWPDRLFADDARRSVRFTFPGYGAFSLRDLHRAQHRNVRVTYTYGRDTLRLLRRCVRDHRRNGRL